ncbi:type VI secretion system protein ImpJ [Cricetibacter osteomyelitidis]|uniref:Type VI secretion system protein ImpJ n=1 Tax=Cricetibacter osteomyelitidis TaxID=1521931 RepID=A0A4R2SQ23_9PAST|nr:type VI secretion system baseplate subunit TssK [Cricetibacter osteomyelitidis]TCP91175.1 type VI secretion system protein ImpJ [Cricetibacter osteomyelitidis]
MTVTNRVLWKEGLFIRPHHFQQESRFFASQVKQTLETAAFNFGFEQLSVEVQHLTYGKFSLSECKGVMPDGTLFHLPITDELPAPLEIKTSAVGKIIYLCLPLNIEGNAEIAHQITNDSLIDYRGEALFTEIKDVHSESGDYAQLELIKNQYFLKLETDDLSNYATLPIARIKDVTLNNQVLLDETFYPAAIALQALTRFSSKLLELTELIALRAKYLANRMSSPEQSGVADVNDFLMLLSLNRALPLFKFLAKSPKVHPSRAYEILASLQGELSTFALEERISEQFYDYIHVSPHTSLEPLYSDVKSYLSVVSNAKALPLPITAHQYGIYTAQVKDNSLYRDAEFIIAVKARLQPELLRTQFVQQTKISSIEQINKLVHLQLPGIPLQSLPVAPRYLPYHSGFVYFQLDKTSPYWNSVISSAGFGFHIAGNYPDLEIEFWAIRGALV